MSKDLGIRAAVRKAIGEGSDHWTLRLAGAREMYPHWVGTPNYACTRSATQHELDHGWMSFWTRNPERSPRRSGIVS
jgi:hypothetical protein